MTLRNKSFAKRAFLAAVLLSATAMSTTALPATAAEGQTESAMTLEQGFAAPPSSARPRVWWHWMNGNVTKDGIKKDLEWLHRIGIGGVQNFDASLQTPQIVDERLVYMTDPWKDAFRFAVNTADSLGMEFAIASSPGWSVTGGPWVKPEDGMKKLVWSETEVVGGKKLTAPLPAAPTTTGPYQQTGVLDYQSQLADANSAVPRAHGKPIMTLAVPVISSAFATPVITDSDGTKLDATAITDNDLSTHTKMLRGSNDAPSQITITYPKPITVQSARLYLPHSKMPFRGTLYHPTLEAKVDGAWKQIGDFYLSEAAATAGFAPVTASEFRMTLAENMVKRPSFDKPEAGAVLIDFFARKPDPHIEIAALNLMAEPRLNMAEVKAGFDTAPAYHTIVDTRALAGTNPAQVINLTDRVKPDGTVDWTPPKGTNWRILNFGWALTGKTNHPATLEATGLEVDKMDPDAVRRYINHYLDMYADTVGADMMGKHGIRALLTDSIEVGPANWTPKMLEEFEARRGYDPVPFMPAMTGMIVGSVEDTEKFLFDYRQTIAELLVDGHYKTISEVADERGLRLYGEALEDGRPMLGDDLAMRSHADVPMAAMWTWPREGQPRPTLLGDMKGASSVAHIYGQNVVAAESMTSIGAPWAHAPHDLRRIIDMEFAHGVNLPVIHTSPHQPTDDKQPGLSLAIFGQFFTRHETWAEMARPWIDYMARSSYMLQQGRNHADVAIFVGEDEPVSGQWFRGVPGDLPKENAYDFISADALAKVVSVADGQIVTKGGARYGVLYLGKQSEQMTLPTLRRLAALVEGGAKIAGHRPTSTPSKADDRAAFDALVADLWDGGKVMAADSVEDALDKAGIAPDFAHSAARDAQLLFVHRALSDGEIYFVNNREAKAVATEARFRVTGKRPEIWDAVTGTSRAVGYRIEGGQTIVPLEMDAEESFFVVFRDPATADSSTIATPQETAIGTYNTEWMVAFQSGRGGPESLALKTLSPLNESDDSRVKYFSGTARYTKTIALHSAPAKGERLFLDLGKIGDVAEVWVNGKLVGTTWFAPYRVDVTGHMVKGKNAVEIRVANKWINRLIGDAQAGAQKIAFVTAPTYAPDAPLRPAGLVGPVTLISTK